MKKMRLPTSKWNKNLGANQIVFPPSVGEGDIKHFHLACGMRLIITDYKLHQTTVLKHLPPFNSLGIGCCLSGLAEARLDFKHRTSTATTRSGQSAINYGPDIASFRETIAPTRMVRVGVMMEPDQLAAFADQDGQRLPGGLFDPAQGVSRLVDEITPAMRKSIYQVLQCPFQGTTRNLFMEGKTLELLALKLEQLQSPKNRRLDAPGLRRGDLERVRHAASLLAGDLEKTPDLNELARSVGMCRSKLHRCFRSAYGITPFDYLRNRRLETAMLYLKAGEMNVTEAACAVGYSSPSYFTKAFKKHFGCLPGQCCRIGSSVH